ncbi:MAG TPA: phosphoribosyl-AMP cyclohydrolase [Spirochaetota bacterium]|nr:phosphoribosyl-AMP cyclohydrolase [Spirochaetota bacterium]
MSIDIDFTKGNGLIPVIIQDYEDGEVLMLGYMNSEAFDLTVKSGQVHYWSRSKKRIWLKGETSGHFQIVKEMRTDCDNDTLLIKVNQTGGAACHEGYRSCFFRRFEGNNLITDRELVFNPEEKYRY